MRDENLTRDRNAKKKRSLHVFLALCALASSHLWAQSTNEAGDNAAWQVPRSDNLMPHFEEANGRKILYVDGRPFSALAVEIPWWDLIAGRYRETEGAYDYLYPAAEKIGLNALKVLIKWSMVELETGMFNFYYLDNAKAM